MTAASHVAATAKAIAALDFTAENDRITELEAEAFDLNAAVQKASERVNEIAALLRDWKGPDAEAVADALLATDAQSAASLGPDIAALQAESQTLQSAIGELRKRSRLAHDEIRKIKSEDVSDKAGTATEALVAALHADAKRAATEMTTAYAALSAICDATGSGYVSVELSKATAACFGRAGILSGQGMEPIPVPADILAVLAELQTKGPATAKGCRNAVAVPHVAY